MWINGSDWERFSDEYNLGPVAREALAMSAEFDVPVWFVEPPSNWRQAPEVVLDEGNITKLDHQR